MTNGMLAGWSSTPLRLPKNKAPANAVNPADMHHRTAGKIQNTPVAKQSVWVPGQRANGG